MAHNLDLNNLPEFEEVNTNLELGLPSSQVRTHQDNEDDEVMICSPRSFYQVVNRSNEYRRMTELTYQEARSQRGHSASWEANGNRRRRVSTTQVYDGVNPCIRREGVHIVEQNQYAMAPPTSQVAPVERPPIFACPICMDDMVEETSTKCGHIFCGSCIATALAIAKKCPTCRRKLRTKDTFRIYLPTRS